MVFWVVPQCSLVADYQRTSSIVKEEEDDSLNTHYLKSQIKEEKK
jgi:hypothetical protein